MTAPQPSGYDDVFLGMPTAVPIPADGRVVQELTYVHFTVLLDPARRLAVATGVNIDGAQLRELDRSDDWRLDPRVDADEQAGEDYLLTHADTYDTKLSVFTAPVLAADDPPYRGVGIPQLFWKVAAWAKTPEPGGEPRLAATGYVLDQTAQLDDIDLSAQPALQAGDPPPLGPYRTYQVPITDIATLTGLDLGPLVAADRLLVPASTGMGPRDRWSRLHTAAEIRL